MMLFFSVASLTMALAITPTTFVALIGGFFFGWEALIGILVSYPIAALIGRRLGIYLLRKYSSNKWFQHPTYTRLIQELSKRPLRILVFARMSPVLPFAMSNILLAQVSIPMFTYIGGTMLGMLPRSLFALIVGSQAPELILAIQSSSHSIGPWLSIGLLIISSIGLFIVGNRAWKKVKASLIQPLSAPQKEEAQAPYANK